MAQFYRSTAPRVSRKKTGPLQFLSPSRFTLTDQEV